jgi:hypothetical protein
MIILLSSAAFAQKEGIGLYVLNLGKFDIATGTFTADFYLSIKCLDECKTDFEFMNGRAASIEKTIDEPNEKFYRIQANLNSPVDLRRFPFDEQKMQIILEDKELTAEDLRYIPLEDESGIDSSIAFTGWNIDGWTAEAKEHYYPVYNETYSQYVFTINISRIVLNSFFKTFLPVLIIMLIVMFSFIMDPDKIMNRLTVVTSSLVATVMYHVSISNQIPPVGYLNMADKFMIFTYAILLAAVIMNVVMLELLEQNKKKLVEKIHRATEYSVFIAVPLMYTLFFIIMANI